MATERSTRRRLAVQPADELARRWRTTDPRLDTTEQIVAVLLDGLELDDLVIVGNVSGRLAHVTTALEFVGGVLPADAGTVFAWCGATLGDRGDVYALAPRQGVPACQACIRGVTSGRPGSDSDVIVAAFALVGPIDEGKAP